MEQTKKFYQLTPAERREALTAEGALSAADAAILSGIDGLTLDRADHMVENVIGVFSLPLGVARNFVVNGKAISVLMAVEEPSVIAAASNGARIVAQNGGFTAEADAPLMIGQIQVVNAPDWLAAKQAIRVHKKTLLQQLHGLNPTMERLGGGAKDIQVRMLKSTPAGPMLIVHVLLDVRDAMGANAVNTALEHLSPEIGRLTGGEARLRILTNLADRRLARARCKISPATLAMKDTSGAEVVERILQAAAFSEADPYRAVTHNKGILNGIDAVVLATGNDWRAVEAGAHGWAARRGKIRPLSHWSQDAEENLCGEIELPLAVGTVGGATRVHPAAGAALRLMQVTSAVELAEVLACVGLAQNLAALRALSTEGIQKGHMTLHARQVAMAAGASGAAIERIAEQMIRDGNIRVDHAKEKLEP